MKVNDDTIKGLVEGRVQFEVPIWQRQYTWRKASNTQLWQDLIEQYRRPAVEPPPSSGHFFGSFVLSPRDPSAAGVTHFLVIDGQQRLTTLMLLLCAIRDKWPHATARPSSVQRTLPDQQVLGRR